MCFIPISPHLSPRSLTPSLLRQGRLDTIVIGLTLLAGVFACNRLQKRESNVSRSNVSGRCWQARLICAQQHGQRRGRRADLLVTLLLVRLANITTLWSFSLVCIYFGQSCARGADLTWPVLYYSTGSRLFRDTRKRVPRLITINLSACAFPGSRQKQVQAHVVWLRLDLWCELLSHAAAM